MNILFDISLQGICNIFPFNALVTFMISAMEGGHQNKRKLKINSDSLKKMEKYYSSTLEQLCMKFPSIEDKIVNELDYQSLIKLTTASKEMADIHQRSRFFWIRMMQYQLDILYLGNIPKDWRKAVKKSPVEIVREFSKTLQEFYFFSTKNYCIVKCSPMHIAADRGNLQLSKHIIDRSSDKNPKDLYGETPLHWAAENGNFDMCKLIILNAEDTNPGDDLGKTPLHRAACLGYNEICKNIIENVQNKNPGDRDGCTPLHYAAISGNFEICELIVDMVVNKNPANFLKETPLHWAAVSGNFEIFKLIFQKVNDTNPMDNEGFTPFHGAACFGHFDMVKFIIEWENNKSPADHCGFTPLDGATCFKQFEVCKLIIESMIELTHEEQEVRLKNQIRKLLRQQQLCANYARAVMAFRRRIFSHTV